MLPLYWSDPHKIALTIKKALRYSPRLLSLAWPAGIKRFPFDLSGQLKQVKAPTLIVAADDHAPGERQASASVLAKFQVALDRKCWTLSLAGTAGRVL